MAKKTSARRYAQAAFEIAQADGQLDRWQADLQKAAWLCEDPGVVAFLESPAVHLDDKVKLISGRFSDVNPQALNLVYLLISQGRLSLLSKVAAEYQDLLDDHRGVERAEVITAVPLTGALASRLKADLKGITGKEVIISSRVEPGVVGGMVVRVGGKLLDGSTASRLLALKKELAGAGT